MEQTKNETKTPELKHLGQKSPFIYESPDISILEYVPNAFADRNINNNNVKGLVHIEAPEFTSLCPITGQPDFGTIIIDYEPDQKCVESKALKLYLGAFRQQGEFQESIVNRIANDLINLLAPKYLRVEGRFTARGGIALYPSAEYHKK